MAERPQESAEARAAKEAYLRAAERTEPTEKAGPQELWGYHVGDWVETAMGVGRVERVTPRGGSLTPGLAVRMEPPRDHVLTHVFAPYQIRRVS